MAKIPDMFSGIDLLWSEAAAYSIGFTHALHLWRPALKPAGILAASELCWFDDAPPDEAKAFFDIEYPAMQSIQQNQVDIQEAGYTLRNTHILPGDSWTDHFYDELKPRAARLSHHSDAEVRVWASGMVREIDIFERYGDRYGYVFFVMQNPDAF